MKTSFDPERPVVDRRYCRTIVGTDGKGGLLALIVYDGPDHPERIVLDVCPVATEHHAMTWADHVWRTRPWEK